MRFGGMKLKLADAIETQKIEVNGKPAHRYERALNDSSGNPVAVLSLVVDNSQFATALAKDIQQLILLSSGAIVLGGLIAFFISRSIIRPLGAEPHAMAQIAKRVAAGDLDVEFDHDANKGSVYAALQEMVIRLRKLVGQIGASADGVNSGAREISRGSRGLAQRTEEQAAGLVEMVASMRQIEETVTENAQAALCTSELSNHVASVADQGEQIVHRTNSAMQAINESSRQIGEIIGVIDEIANLTAGFIYRLKSRRRG